MLATEERNAPAVNVARSGLVVELAKKSFGLSWPRNPSLLLRSRPFGYHLGRQERLFDHVLDAPHACNQLLTMLELAFIRRLNLHTKKSGVLGSSDSNFMEIRSLDRFQRREPLCVLH